MASFVHLHVHSNFSFMDGAADLGALVARAAAYGMPAIALTDHQGLSGAVRFYRAAQKAGIRPLIGAEVVVEPAGCIGDEGDAPPDLRLPLPPPAGFGRAAGHGFHLTLLAKDRIGYANLCALLTRMHLGKTQRPSVAGLEDLARCSRGLIGLSGCPYGEAGAAVLAGRPGRAERALTALAQCFAPGDFYVELMNLLVPESPRYVATLVALADRLGLPVVATNDVHYVEKRDFRLHDVLAAAGARTRLPGPYDRQNAELWLKPASEMRRLFAGVPSACDATLEIAERCDLDLGLGTLHFPSVEVPRGETPYSVLAKEAWAGLERRYRPITPEAVARLERELAAIQELGFAEYFLVVKDIVDFARSRNIRATGRGSAGDSIVTYALGITDADPIRHDLLFERFLNPARRQMPDIDIDFDSRRRDEVVAYIYRRFGDDHVAMVATIQTMGARGAVRTAARALGLPPREVDALSRNLPWASARRLREVLATYPECRNHPLHDEERYGLVVEIAEELAGFPMHLGTHLGGFIITKEPVWTWAPLQVAGKGVAVAQYDKDDVEALGLVKMDILGLRMHSAISDAVALARARLGEDAVSEPFDLPPDDPEVFAMIARADTVGVFQLESSGQRNLATRLKPRTFGDIIAAISLFRPGPLEAEMITPFIRRRHGIEPVSVPHPAMEEVLRDSYGVILYQEQVLRVAHAIAGFSLSEADLLRRAMTKDRSRAEMEAIRERFVEHAVTRGIERSVAEEVFRQIEGFAAYGFCKAHAACFAVVSYASAWLKRYFPAEFACAILNNEPMGYYTPRAVLNDVRRHGVEVMPLHVNSSEAAHSVEADGQAIRIGLKDVCGITQRTLSAIVQERKRRPFRDLADFLRRTRADIFEAEQLVRVGALDGLGLTDARRPPTRDEMLAMLPELKAVIAREGVAGDDVLLIAPGRARPSECPEHPSGWSVARRVSAELEILGLSVSCHPLDLAREDLDRRGVVRAADLPGSEDRASVRVVGVRERAQTPPTRSGKRTCFLTLEDATGLLDVVVFEDVLQRFGDVIVSNRAYLVEGTLQNNPERGLAIVAERIEPYVVRARDGAPVRLRRAVPSGPLGPQRGLAGVPEDEGDTACATCAEDP
ncbi:DNA polymerase III subunit alpha [Coriobacteriia bacterium Es71-Z0120]|uniref:DNA polymerase III subunit alpha n=1 Tax=Parvivirga hydrogeniphila TaxID=2939460 RepID=UPI002260E049|nr:DNA polymerase III subunit alpha [Parvivirga hydrogeniphila]MCL4079075.1 DNA polymerase III subunit alpha [Parvivirga hydrogeniphila]